MSFSKQIFTFCFLFAACLPRMSASDVETLFETDMGRSGNFCGTNSLFIALNLLENVPETYEELLTSFPKVKEEGCNLASVKAYLDKKTNLHSRLMFRTDKQISQLDGTKTVAIVFVERKPISHVFLMRPTSDGIQAIDFPHHWKIFPADFDKKEKVMLLISKEPIPKDRKFLFYASSFCLILSLIVFFYPFINRRIKKRRNQPKEKGLAT